MISKQEYFPYYWQTERILNVWLLQVLPHLLNAETNPPGVLSKQLLEQKEYSAFASLQAGDSFEALLLVSQPESNKANKIKRMLYFFTMNNSTY